MFAVVVVHTQIAYVIPLKDTMSVSSLYHITRDIVSPFTTGLGSAPKRLKEGVRNLIVDSYVTPLCRGKCF